MRAPRLATGLVQRRQHSADVPLVQKNGGAHDDDDGEEEEAHACTALAAARSLSLRAFKVMERRPLDAALMRSPNVSSRNVLSNSRFALQRLQRPWTSPAFVGMSHQ
jgi:hypothetical protein